MMVVVKNDGVLRNGQQNPTVGLVSRVGGIHRYTSTNQSNQSTAFLDAEFAIQRSQFVKLVVIKT